jgi:tRNA modification GTPase
MYSLDDTIAAIASPPGGAARGIVRLSGAALRACLENCFRPVPYVSLPALRGATAVPGLCWLRGIAAPLPGELYLWAGQRSYTGQPVAELHTLGSPPLLQALLRTVCAAGARPAEPGEFTLRAFLAGRLDLTQAEAVLGVIDAADPRQLHVALEQLAGGLTQPLHRLRDGLLDLLAHLEAGLDFADEDLPLLARDDLVRRLDVAAATVAGLVAQMASRQDSTELARVVLAGRPNSGKSSLFNALAGAAALVSDRPGTTRDYLVAELDLRGVRCQLVDTAGIGEAETKRGQSQWPPSYTADGDLEEAAQTASRQQHQRADVRLLCLDATQPPEDGSATGLRDAGAAEVIVVLTKTDLGTVPIFVAGSHENGTVPFGRTGEFVLPQRESSADPEQPTIQTSSRTGAGLEALRERLRRAVLARRSPAGDVVTGTAVRCGQSLTLAAECLHRARQIALDGAGEELVAADLRVALQEVGKVAGAVYTEDVLERIFSRFCIGK